MAIASASSRCCGFSKDILKWSVVILCLVVLCLPKAAHSQFWDIRGDYCKVRRPTTCCTGRDDLCSMPILGTLCYCDMFCNRTDGADCCPDFWEHCLGQQRPRPDEIRIGCVHNGRLYNISQSYKDNCNKCVCRQKSSYHAEFVCEDKACLIRPELIETVNRGNYGWTASNYSFLWGKTLEEGIHYRLGTFQPSRPTMQMHEIGIKKNRDLPENFDSREKWPGLIQPVRDQGDCGASWAFSTTALAADRLSIQSMGTERMQFSPQQLISCQHKGQRGCLGGHLDMAWWYLRRRGVVDDRCYPYESGRTGSAGSCRIPRSNSHQPHGVRCPTGGQSQLYFTTPPYRVGPREEVIMQEIYTNGPVQATFRVHEDFFIYRGGVYRRLPSQYLLHDRSRMAGWHSVRIIGWGVDRTQYPPIKYWLCANSWGTQWGENGLFRILRGEDECNIEMFIVGVWAKSRTTNGNHHFVVDENSIHTFGIP